MGPNGHQNGSTDKSLNSVYFTNNNKGWIVGNTGTILNTTNGGTNWSAQNGGVINSLNSVFFTDGNTGWAVGQPGIIIKTINGGNNWSAQNVGYNLNLLSVYFANNNTGWVVGKGYSSSNMFKTTNGGLDWTNESIGVNSLNSVFFSAGNSGWIVGDRGTILKTNGVITSIQNLSSEILSSLLRIFRIRSTLQRRSLIFLNLQFRLN
ncbi:MAG: YCF48-related protein [Ignavibacteria bacterium]